MQSFHEARTYIWLSRHQTDNYDLRGLQQAPAQGVLVASFPTVTRLAASCVILIQVLCDTLVWVEPSVWLWIHRNNIVLTLCGAFP